MTGRYATCHRPRRLPDPVTLQRPHPVPQQGLPPARQTCLCSQDTPEPSGFDFPPNSRGELGRRMQCCTTAIRAELVARTGPSVRRPPGRRSPRRTESVAPLALIRRHQRLDSRPEFIRNHTHSRHRSIVAGQRLAIRETRPRRPVRPGGRAVNPRPIISVRPWPAFPKKPTISSVTAPWVRVHSRAAMTRLPSSRIRPAAIIRRTTACRGLECHRPLGSVGGTARDRHVGADLK